MLRVHEVVAVVKRTYPTKCLMKEKAEKGPLLLRTHPQPEGRAELRDGRLARERTSLYQLRYTLPSGKETRSATSSA